MSFDEQWAQHQSAAAGKQHMRLNNAGTDGGKSSTDGLVVHQDDLGAVGHDAYILHRKFKKHSDIDTAGRDGSESSSTERAARALKGSNFQLGPALSKTNNLWERQREVLLQGCVHIANHLKYSKKHHAKDDDDIADAMRKPASVSAIYKYIK